MIKFGFVIDKYYDRWSPKNRFLEWLKVRVQWEKHLYCAQNFLEEFFEDSQIKNLEELEKLYSEFITECPQYEKCPALPTCKKDYGMRYVEWRQLPKYFKYLLGNNGDTL